MLTEPKQLTPHEYNGIAVFVDELGEPWLTQKQMAKLLGITRQNVSQILAFGVKSKAISLGNKVIFQTKRNGARYRVQCYSSEVLGYIKSRSHKQFSYSDKEILEIHPLANRYLEGLFKKVSHHVPMPISGTADFVCTGNETWICEVKNVSFKTRHIEQVLDYCHQWQFSYGVIPQPMLLYVNCDAKIHDAYCKFVGVKAISIEVL